MAFMTRWGCSLGVIAIVSAGSGFGSAAIASAQQVDSPPAQPAKSEKKAKKKTRKQVTEDADQTPLPASGARGRTVTGGAVTAGSQVTNDGTASDIVVIGIKGSIDSAINRKRNSKQIVDSIVSEDAGKLPDNTVGEAIARIPGVNITRSQGGADGFTIRGQTGIQTTVNGQDVSVGDARAISLSDIPAELIKSVDVYKSRSASQPEGGVGGTVNVELRRPLELKKGWLIAGSVRGVYDDLTRKIQPSGSLLASYRFDTGMGEMGLLLNGSYRRTSYSETFATNESADKLIGGQLLSVPADLRDRAAAPFRIQYQDQSGNGTETALSAAYQWKPTENLSFFLEGTYFGSTSNNRDAGLSLLTRADNPTNIGPTLTNVILGKSGAIQSATYTAPEGQSLPLFAYGGTGYGKNHTAIGNFETHWAAGIARLDFSVNYQESNGDSRGVGYGQQYRGVTVADVRFNDPIVSGGIPTFTLPGVDLTDPAVTQLGNFGDRADVDRTRNLIVQFDGSLNLSNSSFLRQFQYGIRYARKNQENQYGYRNVRFDGDGPYPPLASLNIPTQVLSPRINGGTPFSFVALDPGYVFDNWATLRQQIVALNPAGFDGNGPTDSIASFLEADIPRFDRQQGGKFVENNMAAYAQLNWAITGGLPMEGQVGIRYVNIYGFNEGARLVIPNNPDGSCCGEAYTEDNNARGNYTDLLPSANAVVHWTSKLQSHLSYNYNVQRPSFYATRATLIIEQPNNPLVPIYAGNPDLKPYTDHNFNGTIEWYPGSGTSFSVNTFYKKQSGFIYYTFKDEPVPELGGQIRRVFKERNAGPGENLGFEFASTIPFSIISNAVKGFGITANATWIPLSTIDIPDETGGNFIRVNSAFTSRFTTNVILFYEDSRWSGRVAYNWRSSFRTNNDVINRQWNAVGYPQQRLDAAINYTPVSFMTFSIEGTNLMRNIDRFRYDLYPDLSTGARAMARTIQGSIRFRF